MAEAAGVDELERFGHLEAEVLDQAVEAGVAGGQVVDGDGGEFEDEGEMAAVGAVDPEVLEGGEDVGVGFGA